MIEGFDKGFIYLITNDEDMFDDGTGWGYTEADGSSTYRWSDGSWGEKNSDGSASYHGSDGSWGDRNSDGDGDFHGADSSWGTICIYGDSYFYAADGSWGTVGSPDHEDYSESYSSRELTDYPGYDDSNTYDPSQRSEPESLIERAAKGYFDHKMSQLIRESTKNNKSNDSKGIDWNIVIAIISLCIVGMIVFWLMSIYHTL